MKKFFSLLLAALMCLCSLSAIAEDIDLTGIEAPALDALSIEKDAFALTEAKLASTSDVVEVNGDVTKVTTGGVTIAFDANAAGGGYIVLSQDMLASLSAYMNFKDPASIQAILLDNDIHIYIIDLFTTGELRLRTLEPDGLTAIAPNLSALSVSNQKVVADCLLDSYELVNINGTTWIYGSSGAAVTIVNGWYVVLNTSSDVTAEDAMKVLSGVSVTAAK